MSPVTALRPSACTQCRLPSRALCREATTCVSRAFDLMPVDWRAPAGAVIMDAGSVASEVFIVRSGVLQLEQEASDGERRIVGLVGIGGSVGLEAWLGRPALTRVVAWTESALCRVPVEELRRQVAREPALSDTVFAALHDAQGASYEWTVETTCGPLRTRLLRLLLRLTRLFGGPRICLPTREDMGAMLGVTTESASRAVSQLRRIGLLRSCASSTEYIVRIAAVHQALDPSGDFVDPDPDVRPIAAAPIKVPALSIPSRFPVQPTGAFP